MPRQPVRRHLVDKLLPMKNMQAGALRSVTCMAMEDGATLVSVPRDLFISFIAAKPRTLQIYLHKVRSSTLHVQCACFAMDPEPSRACGCTNTVHSFSKHYLPKFAVDHHLVTALIRIHRWCAMHKLDSQAERCAPYRLWLGCGGWRTLC